MGKYFIDEFGVKYSSDRKRVLGVTKDLIQYTIPEGTEIIESFAFNGNSNIGQPLSLKSISLPTTLRVMEEGCFAYCSNLAAIEIPCSVEQIDGGVFTDIKQVTSKSASFQIIGNLVCQDKILISSFGQPHKVIIPNFILAIQAEAFAASDTTFEGIEEIVLGKNTRMIGARAFVHCHNLHTVIIPQGLISIGEEAFAFCESLQQINLPQTIKQIDNYAFSMCNALPKISIPKGVEVINEHTFSGCWSLQQIDLPSGLREIKDCAFQDCWSISQIIIPEGVTSIGDHAFSVCVRLQSIVLPQSLKKIHASAFHQCKSLLSIIIPVGATKQFKAIFAQYIDDDKEYYLSGNAGYKAGDWLYIDEDEIDNNHEINFNELLVESKDAQPIITEVVPIDENDEEIEDEWDEENSEYSLDDLEYVETDEGMEIIHPQTGYKVKLNYTSSEDGLGFGIDISDNMDEILGDEDEDLDEEDWDDEYDDENDDDNSWEDEDFEEDGIEYVYSPDGKILLEDQSTNEICNIKEGTIEIAPKAFESSWATKVNLPDSIRKIGEAAFSCSAVTCINLPNGITEIRANTFECCDGLEYIDLPKTLTKISKEAFSSCHSLKEIIIPQGVKSIERQAFENCTSLQTIELPPTLQKIGAEAFSGCEALEVVNIPEGIITIEQSAFAHCHNLHTIYLPSSLQKVGKDIFICSDAINTIIVPHNCLVKFKRLFSQDDINSDFIQYMIEDTKRIIQSNKTTEAPNSKDSNDTTFLGRLKSLFK